MHKVNTAYQDREGRSVCGGCGSYYVVTPEEARKVEASEDMYESLKELMVISVGCWRHGHPVFDKVRQVLAKEEGKC